MTTERFKQINLPADIIDIKTSKIYHTITGNDGYELCILLNELHEENEQLKKRLDELETYNKEEFAEVEHINDIYKEKGFCGVIAYAKDKLQYYGVVKEVEKGLWVMVTGGWSDNEFWLNCLNNPISIFGMKHYRGYLRGGAFYYTEKPRGDVEIILKGDVE